MSEILLTLHSLTQALIGQDTQFHFRHIEPRTIPGRVMPLNTFRKTTRFFWLKSFAETVRLMRIEIVLHHDDFSAPA
jgi:hypothetical protein